MLLTRTFAQRRMMLVAMAGALVLCTFLALPQGRAFASTLLLFFRGQSIQPYSTTYANLVNAYQTLQELEKLGTLQGQPPTVLNPSSSLSAASKTAGFTPLQPATLPTGFTGTPSSIKALGPSTVTLTLQKAIADAYFHSIGSSQTMPALYDGEQIVVSFPGVTLLEYTGSAGGEVYVGEAGQMQVQVSGNASVSQLRTWLLQLPGLSSSTASALQNINNWQYTIPLGVPTDKAGFTPFTVSGTYGGSGAIINDNTGIFSAVMWQGSSGTLTLGVGGRGLTAQQVQSVAGSLH
jgi:hypothetical protein